MTLEPLSALLPAVVAQLAHHNPGRTPMTPYYDRQGNPVSLDDWMSAYDESKRQVADTTIGDVRVSTVFLGLDHNWGDGPPHIFETMVFGDEFGAECERYSTEAQAVAGHAEIVARVEAAKA